MIKKIIIPILFVTTVITASLAQRVAVVDVNGILEQMSEFTLAQEEIDKVSADWRQDIAKEYDKIKSLYNKYQAEQVLLSDDVKLEREEEIMEKEKQVRELQKRRFGPEGDLFRRRQELISPIQDEVFNAIQDFAKVKGYDLIFDKAGAAGLLYASDDFDKTNDVKRELGLKTN